MNIQIRTETFADYYAVEELTREAFWKFWEPDRTICDEHLLVSKLRNCLALVPELNCIAEIGGKIVGHIIYTKSWIEDSSGTNHETLTFGPLSVLPEYQNKGIGKALMQYTFDKARHLGFRAVIIFGNPDYYPRIDFKRAAEFAVTAPDGSVFDALMVYELYDKALEKISGKYSIDPAYEELTQEAALEFDKKFPHKAPYIQTSIDMLLERLDTTAANALREKGFRTLDIIKSQSECEIALLSGMNQKSVETIRKLMRERGFNWGK